MNATLVSSGDIATSVIAPVVRKRACRSLPSESRTWRTRSEPSSWTTATKRPFFAQSAQPESSRNGRALPPRAGHQASVPNKFRLGRDRPSSTSTSEPSVEKAIGI